MLSGGTKNVLMKMTVAKTWGPRRSLPEIAPKSFSELWKEKNKE